MKRLLFVITLLLLLSITYNVSADSGPKCQPTKTPTSTIPPTPTVTLAPTETPLPTDTATEQPTATMTETPLPTETQVTPTLEDPTSTATGTLEPTVTATKTLLPTLPPPQQRDTPELLPETGADLTKDNPYKFWIGFVIGLIVGANFGLLIFGLCSASNSRKDADFG